MPDGWCDAATIDDGGASLVDELRREVAPGHVLFGVSLRASARCAGHCDDAVFDLADGRVALVHLSYPRTEPDTPPWPITTLFDDAESAVRHLRAHLEVE